MKILDYFKSFRKPKYDISFIDTYGDFWQYYPPIKARELKPLKEYQMSAQNEYRFVRCPGMLDYTNLGYIIPAWYPFHIKANKAGTVVIAGQRKKDHKFEVHPSLVARNMDQSIPNGTFNFSGVKKEVFICPSPWKIKGAPGVSLIATAPYFHNPEYIDNLFVYPGVVDYNGFSTINFVFSVKKECEITIKQGDPLLHVIPIFSTKEFKASYRPVENFERRSLDNVQFGYENNFYRRFFNTRKKFSIECEKDTKKYGNLKQ